MLVVDFLLVVFFVELAFLLLEGLHALSFLFLLSLQSTFLLLLDFALVLVVLALLVSVVDLDLLLPESSLNFDADLDVEALLLSEADADDFLVVPELLPEDLADVLASFGLLFAADEDELVDELDALELDVDDEDEELLRVLFVANGALTSPRDVDTFFWSPLKVASPIPVTFSKSSVLLKGPLSLRYLTIASAFT